MNLGKRIAKAIDLSGVSAPDVARASGVPVATLNALMRRDSKMSTFTEAIVAALPQNRVNLDWVRTGRGTPDPLNHPGGAQAHGRELERPAMQRSVAVAISGGAADSVGVAAAPLRSWEHPEELPPGEWVFVPRLGVLQPEAATDETKTVFVTDEIQAFRAQWIRVDQLKPSALAWHEAHDASMEPAIFRGDSYVIDTSATSVMDGKAYAVLYGGQLRPRRLLLLPTGGIRVQAMNPDFATVDVAPADAATLRIIGRIVHRAGKGGL